MISVDEVESYFAGDERIMDCRTCNPTKKHKEIFEFHNKPETVVSSSEVFVQKQNAPQSFVWCMCLCVVVCLCVVFVLCVVRCVVLYIVFVCGKENMRDSAFCSTNG